MNLNLLNRYLYHQRKTFEKCYPRIQDVTDDEAIHDIRVSIKKTRTLLLLLDYMYPDEWDIRTLYRPYRKIFKRLGLIRDLQVQHKLAAYLKLKTAVDIVGYQSFLKQQEKTIRFDVNAWLRHSSLPNWRSLEADLHSCYFRTGKKMIILKANEYIACRIQKAKKLTAQKDRTTIHLIRRLLKEARYMIDMMSSVLKDKTEYKELQTQIKPIENYLGEWHDRTVALDYIFQYEQFMHTYFPGKIVRMKTVVKKIIQENNVLVNKALRAINRLK
ncbi:MAG: CHAD domain-containing protein [Bacteroidales bacterium]|nr:CHAD domain-containing protein [Lentimicrobiaceae bacterium]MDD5694124.1 CHAD domain-containing protein [Bacteroidales bacterium]